MPSVVSDSWPYRLPAHRLHPCFHSTYRSDCETKRTHKQYSSSRRTGGLARRYCLITQGLPIWNNISISTLLKRPVSCRAALGPGFLKVGKAGLSRPAFLNDYPTHHGCSKSGTYVRSGNVLSLTSFIWAHFPLIRWRCVRVYTPSEAP